MVPSELECILSFINVGNVTLEERDPVCKYHRRVDSTIDSEEFKGGTRGAPIMPRDAVSRTAHVGTVGTNGLN